MTAARNHATAVAARMLTGDVTERLGGDFGILAADYFSLVREVRDLRTALDAAQSSYDISKSGLQNK